MLDALTIVDTTSVSDAPPDAAVPPDTFLFPDTSLFPDAQGSVDSSSADTTVVQGCELTESNAASWAYAPCDTLCASLSSSCSASLANETARVMSGSASIKFSCDSCGFENVVLREHPSSSWNLSAFDTFFFYAWSEYSGSSPKPWTGWQDDTCNPNPWLYLVDTNGRRRLVVRAHTGGVNSSYFNGSKGRWMIVQGPIAASTADWTISSEAGFDLSQVKRIELHMDPWDYGFTLWLDGFTFLNGQTGASLTDCP